MIDRLQLYTVMTLCEKYKYRFNSSKIQIKNGTVSLIINGKLWEISCTYQVRERIVNKNPYPFEPTSAVTKKNLSDKDNYVDALVALHERIGDGDLDKNVKPTYLILFKNAPQAKFIKMEFPENTNFNNIKNQYKMLCMNFGIYKSSPTYQHRNTNNGGACVMLIEYYNGHKRLLNIRNTIEDLNTKEVNQIIERS